jgi:sensor histidine kinase regulating citrate/malate metabolism
MGMDSLMGMELGLAVQENFQVKLPMMAVSEGATVLGLAARIVASSTQHENAGSGSADTMTQQATALAKIHAVEAEVEAHMATPESQSQSPTTDAPAQPSEAF